MAIITQLGLNDSFFYQFIIFCIAYVALSRWAFAPYNLALTQREQKTVGGEELAVELAKETQDLKTKYEVKARQVSGEVKSIFDEHRTAAQKEQERIVFEARSEANKTIDTVRKKVETEISQAKTQLKAEVSQISQEMIKKLLAK